MTARAVLIALSSALLVACASQPVTEHAVQPAAPRPASTIFVPARQSPLNTRIRQSLAADGWRLVEYTDGAGNTKTDARVMAQQARYRLTLDGRPAGKCRNDGPGYAYQISIIENRSGKVPLAMSGTDCLAAIVPQFQQRMLDERLSAGPRVSTDQAPLATQAH